MLESSDLVAFVPADDVAVARQFYAETLGLRLVEETAAACVFDANGTMLRVTPVPEVTLAPYTLLGWVVDDVGAMVSELRRRGIETDRFEGLDQDELGIWSAPGGNLVAWFRDPSGNRLSLTQLLP